jgi:hypothetical protein
LLVFGFGSRSEGQFANRALICDGSSKSKPSRSHLEGRGSLHVVHDDVAADARQSGSQAVRQSPCTALLRCKENARGMQTQTRMQMQVQMQVQMQMQTSPARKAASSALPLSRIAPATEMSVSLEEGGETRDERRGRRKEPESEAGRDVRETETGDHITHFRITTPSILLNKDS